MQWIFLDTENLVGVPSFKRVCFRFPEMPQELNCEEENKLIILTNWVLMSLHSEQLALLQAWILNNAIMCASQECKFRSCLTPQWLHWSSYAVTSENNLNCSRGPAIYPHTKTGPKEKGHKIWKEQPCKSARAPALGGFLALFGPWQGEGPVFWRCCGGGARGGGPVPEEGRHLLAGRGWSPIDVDVTVDLLRVGKLDVWWIWRRFWRGRGSRVPLWDRGWCDGRHTSRSSRWSFALRLPEHPHVVGLPPKGDGGRPSWGAASPRQLLWQVHPGPHANSAFHSFRGQQSDLGIKAQCWAPRSRLIFAWWSRTPNETKETE